MKTDTPWSVRMADTVLTRWADLPPSWSHEYGVMFEGLLDVWNKTGDQRYFDYVKRHVDAVIDKNGAIEGYELEHFSLDHLVSGRLLFPLFEKTGDERYKKAIALLRNQFRHHPRTSDGGFWHNGELKNQMLLDGIYMGVPFYAECARADNDTEGMNDAIKQVMLLVEHNRDAKTGLFYHGWDADRKQVWADPKTGNSPSFWGRATGWYSMAIVDLLDYVPESHPQRQALVDVLRDLMSALVRVQDPARGLWWHVLDQGNREGNYLEASASLMFLYTLAKGVKKGYLTEETFRAALDKGYDGALNHLIKVESDGLLTVCNVCKTAGLGVKPGRDGSFSYYISEPVVENDHKGVAGFILASVAKESLA